MQKYHNGDLVRVTKKLNPGKNHFESDCNAIVEYSYDDKYGCDYTDNYSLYLEGIGSTAWYEENELTLIKRNQKKLLSKWKKEEKNKEKKESNLDWIFNNGDKIAKQNSVSGNIVTALAAELGCNNMWGNNGEGYNWYNNAMATLSIANPFLKGKDKDGFLKECEQRLKQYRYPI